MADLKPRDFADVWAFVKVVDTGSFSQAARQMGSTKANVSKQVARLERALQVKLLNRSTRRIGLSEAGNDIFPHALRMVDEARAMEARIVGLQAGPGGTLRIATSMAFGNVQLAGLLPEFMERYPEIRVVLSLADRLVDLVEENVDVALRLSPRIDLMSAVARPVATLRHVLAASPGYCARHGLPQTFDDLRDHRCLVFGASGAAAFWQVASGASFRPAAGLAINSSQALHAAMLAGAGIALLPTYVVGEDIRAGRAIHVLPALRPAGLFGDQLFAVYLQDRFLPQKVRVFIDYLLEKLGEHPPWDAFLATCASPSG